jgi:hypothetical protein
MVESTQTALKQIERVASDINERCVFAHTFWLMQIWLMLLVSWHSFVCASPRLSCLVLRLLTSALSVLFTA